MNRDAEYLAAVKRGDMATAQRMVDQAAYEAGYTIGPLYHRTSAKNISEFYIWTNFGTEEQSANVDLTGRGEGDTVTYRVFLKIKNPIRVRDEGMAVSSVMQQAREQKAISAKDLENFPYNRGDELERKYASTVLLQKGYDGIVYENEFEGPGDSYIALIPTQIKSADAVTYDNSGKVIPLSRRFDSSSSDIRNPMKTNHTADEIVTIEGPQDHSLDIERVRTVIDDEMHRVGVVYVTFHFIHNRKHRTHSDDFAPSDNWFPVIEELFDEVTAVYKVTIQPSDRLGKAKRLRGNPGGYHVSSFTIGGGVIHKIPFRGNYLSAWYDQNGNLIEIEGHTPNHRPVRVGADARAHAQQVGRAYLDRFKAEEVKGNPSKTPFQFRMGMDTNGNRIVHIKTRHGGFSIQTNGNLPETHRKGAGDWTAAEVSDFVRHYGTPRQREILFQSGISESREPLDNPRSTRQPTRMGVVLGNAIRGNPVTATGSHYSSSDPNKSAQAMSHL